MPANCADAVSYVTRPLVCIPPYSHNRWWKGDLSSLAWFRVLVVE